jgi:hypothetical protein
MGFAREEAQKRPANLRHGLRGINPQERVQVQTLPASILSGVGKTVGAAFGPQTTAPNK